MNPNVPTGETMSDGDSSGMPPELSGPEAPQLATVTVVVPVSALAMPDETENMEPPAVGDMVNYQVEGKVVSIAGDKATVDIQSVNGKPLEPNEQDDAASEGPESLESLQKQAEEQGALA